MKVCIAEKPSVAKEIADVLGAKIRKDGFFEGNGYRVTWTFGHLCTLKAPYDYTPQWKRWSLETLPMIPEKFEIKMIPNRGVGKQFKVIKSLFKDCSEIINCGDAGIEGELIQRWVLMKAACKKPVKRLWISSLTEEAIREGFQNLKDASEYDLLYAAGNARAISDWILGMNASRLYTLKYANGKGVLSIGRVQTPTLALIVQRYNEIKNFKPEPYWELKTMYRDVLFSAVSGRFKDKNQGQEALDKIKDSIFTITSFSKKKGKEQPPLLFDLTSLQVECNKKFGFTADNTLKVVQKLYEKKLVSYPRVDTRVLPSDMYPKVPGILAKLKEYSEFTSPLLAKPLNKIKRVFDDRKVTDHHAIIPTGVVPKNSSPQEEKIYDIIARRFIAVFYPDCILSNTTVLGETEGVKFKAVGKEIIDDGWRVLYPKVEKSDKDKKESQSLPEFQKGESGPHKPDLQEKETKPPKPYTEGTLLRAMETAGKQVDDEMLRELMKENGIGRPSTRANIIETLFKRSYIVRERKNIVPTVTGIQLIASIQNELLKSVELTGMWENRLRQIEKGDYESVQFLNDMKSMIIELVMDVKNESSKSITIEPQKDKGKFSNKKYSNNKYNNSNVKNKISNAAKEKNVKPEKSTEIAREISQLKCPLCNSGMIIKGNSAYGCSEFRGGCAFRINFVIEGKKLNEKQVFDLIKKGKTSLLSGFIIKGEKVKGQIFFNDKFAPVFIPGSEEKKKVHEGVTEAKAFTSKRLICPICSTGYMIKGRRAYGCSCFREGCDFVVPFDELREKFGSDVLTERILGEFVK